MGRTKAALGTAVFFVIAPGVVAGAVPWLLTRWRVGPPGPHWIVRLIGVLLIGAGVAALLSAFVRFVREGRGTPAPVAPTQDLVVGGLYRYVRNPMYLAVIAIIAGQALLLGRPRLLAYNAGVLAMVSAFVHWYEEPILRRRFGGQYEAYRRAVPGWVPRRHRRNGPWIALLVLAALLAGCQGQDAPALSDGPTPETAGGATPVIDSDFPDPDTIRVGDTYYAYATQPADGSKNVQVASSSDLKTWEILEEDPLPELPRWATKGRTWAPEVTALASGKGFALYFTARNVKPDLQCIGVAVAKAALGPFRPIGQKPLVCPAKQGGAIDAATFDAADGTKYLLWKNDGNCCDLDTWLYLQRLSPDGRRLVGKPHRLLKQDQPWEGELIEAPTLVQRDGAFVLLYSANSYAGAEYATGYATANNITGPYTKAAEPLLSTEATQGRYTGPGGQDVITDAHGDDHLVFHDWDDAIFYRSVHVVDVTFGGGKPVVTLPGG